MKNSRRNIQRTFPPGSFITHPSQPYGALGMVIAWIQVENMNKSKEARGRAPTWHAMILTTNGLKRVPWDTFMTRTSTIDEWYRSREQGDAR
jgi:hypothetical protein